jgi:hypothetical protein
VGRTLLGGARRNACDPWREKKEIDELKTNRHDSADGFNPSCQQHSTSVRA